MDFRKQIVNQINECISTLLWLDFDVMYYNGYRMIISGGIDEAEPPKMLIAFDEVSFYSGRTSWKSEPSESVLSIVEGDEEAEIRKRFDVEYRHAIFKFIPAEAFAEEPGFYIAAEKIFYMISPTIK